MLDLETFLTRCRQKGVTKFAVDVRRMAGKEMLTVCPLPQVEKPAVFELHGNRLLTISAPNFSEET